MLSNYARLALSDMRDNCELAKKFVAGMSLEEFKVDRSAPQSAEPKKHQSRFMVVQVARRAAIRAIRALETNAQQ